MVGIQKTLTRTKTPTTGWMKRTKSRKRVALLSTCSR
jgi:hypothetical protein